MRVTPRTFRRTYLHPYTKGAVIRNRSRSDNWLDAAVGKFNRDDIQPIKVFLPRDATQADAARAARIVAKRNLELAGTKTWTDKNGYMHFDDTPQWRTNKERTQRDAFSLYERRRIDQLRNEAKAKRAALAQARRLAAAKQNQTAREVRQQHMQAARAAQIRQSNKAYLSGEKAANADAERLSRIARAKAKSQAAFERRNRIARARARERMAMLQKFARNRSRKFRDEQTRRRFYY